MFSLRTLGAWLGPFDLHLERTALRIRFGARRHAARLVRLLYVGIEVYNEVADADVPLIVIVFKVGGMRVRRGARSAGRRAFPHWRRHPRLLAAPTATRLATNTIVARSQCVLTTSRNGNPKMAQFIQHFNRSTKCYHYTANHYFTVTINTLFCYSTQQDHTTHVTRAELSLTD